MKNKEIEELLNKFKNADSQQFNELVEDFDNVYKLLSYIEQLEKRNKQLYEGFMATQEELTDYATKNEQLENNRDKAIEFIENHFLYHYGSDKEPIVFEDNYIQEIVDILKGDSDDE